MGLVTYRECLSDVPSHVMSLFAGDGNDIPTILTVRLRSDGASLHTVDITFALKSAYPSCAPDIAMSCPSLARAQTASLKTDLDTYASTLSGEPMLLSLTMWVKEHLENFTVDRTKQRLTNRNDDTSTHRTVLLRLDHMRAKVRYTKTVCQWAEELGLTGRLICYERLIMILLQGSQNAVKVSIDDTRYCKKIVCTSAGLYKYFSPV